MADEPKHRVMNLCGLWEKETKDGEPYLSGKYTHETVMTVFRNTKRTNPKQPSHWVRLYKVGK